MSRGRTTVLAVLLACAVGGCTGDAEEREDGATVTATRAEQRAEIEGHLLAGQAAVGADYVVRDSPADLACDTDDGGTGATALLSRTSQPAPADPDAALLAVRRAWEARGLVVGGDERGAGELRLLSARTADGASVSFGLGPAGTYFNGETTCTER